MLLPASLTNERTPPSDFVQQLKAFDSALVVYWNRFRQRWVIDRCIRGNECSHSGHCERVTALLVEDTDGGYMPLCDRVFTNLRIRDLWRKWDSAEHMAAEQDAEAAQQKDGIERDVRSDFNSAIREDRVQLNRFRHLIQTHDLRPNK